MLVATFHPASKWPGQPITWSGGDFFTAPGREPISAAAMMGYDQLAELIWVNDGIRSWVAQKAHGEVVLDLPPVAQDPQPKQNATRRQRGSGISTLQGAGLIVIVLGLILLFGNISGVLPSFPYAGFIVTAVGGILLTAGRPTAK